jgi:hypothetical protein
MMVTTTTLQLQWLGSKIWQIRNESRWSVHWLGFSEEPETRRMPSDCLPLPCFWDGSQGWNYLSIEVRVSPQRLHSIRAWASNLFWPSRMGQWLQLQDTLRNWAPVVLSHVPWAGTKGQAGFSYTAGDSWLTVNRASAPMAGVDSHRDFSSILYLYCHSYWLYCLCSHDFTRTIIIFSYWLDC